MIIAIANQKGGAGKSTTTAALAAGLTARKYKTLIVDLDPQGNCTDSSRCDLSGALTVFDVLTGKATVAEAVVQSPIGDILPGNIRLSDMDTVLTAVGKEYKLKKALSPTLKKYDYTIIDTPPSAGVLAINALTAADGVVIPTAADKYGIGGLRQVRGTIEAVQEYTNNALRIYGILLTRHTPRRNILRDYAEGIADMAKDMKTKVFKAYIRECTAIREAQSKRKSIFEYDPNSNGAEDYAAFVAEVIKTAAKKGGRNG